MSLAREYSSHLAREARSTGLSFQRLVGSAARAWNRRSCSSGADREPVLDDQDPRAHQHPLELRAGAQELLVLVLRAVAHHPLHAAAVVPGAVEEHDLAGCRQVRHVALEIPLRLLAVRRDAQRHHPRHPRVERVRDGLDGAALAGRVAPLEQDHDLEAGVADPLLHLDQLDLELGQLLLVLLHAAASRGARGPARRPRRPPGPPGTAPPRPPRPMGHRRPRRDRHRRARPARRGSAPWPGRPRVRPSACRAWVACWSSIRLPRAVAPRVRRVPGSMPRASVCAAVQAAHRGRAGWRSAGLRAQGPQQRP